LTVDEQLVVAKTGDPATCEDAVATTADFAFVFDGATDKDPAPEGASTSGRVAGQALAAAVAGLDPGIDVAGAVAELSDVLARLEPQREGVRPSATFAGYSARRREVWRVGDCHWLTETSGGGTQSRIDRVTSQARAAMLRALVASGSSVEELRRDDPGRRMILPLLRQQHVFRNAEKDRRFGFAAIDGSAVPPRFIESQPIDAGTTLVLATDGYPRVFLTLAETEAYLERDIERDPLRIGRHASTKGVAPGEASFDDRAYVRLTT
jgi:glycerophosphoryl diester phosphodiesterase